MNILLKNVIALMFLFSTVSYAYPFENDKDSSNQNKDPKIETKTNPDNNNIKKDTDKESEKPKRRSIEISETFIITDYTRANTFRIDSQKEWNTFKDKVYISYDLFGQKNDNDIEKFRVKKNRVEFNYQLYTTGLSRKEPFIEYNYSSDKSTKLTWKVLSSGIVKKMPFNVVLDIGYGYKWGQITEKEKYSYDVVTLNLNNEKKFSKLTIKQNLKNIIPRSIGNEKQPIYDYRGSLSTPIAKNINGTVNFDCRYQKQPLIKKEDWYNYTIKFGITFVPIK